MAGDGSSSSGGGGGAVLKRRETAKASVKAPYLHRRNTGVLVRRATVPPLPTQVLFGTAGLGGIGAWCVIHPFNTVAVRLNLSTLSNPAAAADMNFVTVARSMASTGGIRSFYDGLSAGIVRQIFYATSRFGLFEVFRDEVAKHREIDFAARVGVGLASGAAAAFISCPAEVSLVRMSNDKALPAAQRRNYSSVLDAAVQIVKTEGPAAFWRGSMPFVNRAMLVGACQVGTYDEFKEQYAKRLGLPKGTTKNVFAAAMSSGLVYSLVTMPFESAKNRMAFQKPDPKTGKLLYTKTLPTIGAIVRSEGFLSLYSGYFPYYLRCGGHTVFMFIFVEQMRKWYRAHRS